MRLLAEYGEFEQNAYWHRRLAKIYRDAAYINAAIKEFSISIRLNGQDYAALEGMALCFDAREDYPSAIEWEYKALAAVPEESKGEKARILQQVAVWKRQLRDNDGAIEASYAAYSLSTQGAETAISYLSALEDNLNLDAILDFATELKTMDSPQEGENMLTFLFLESWGRAYTIIGNAARRRGRTDSVEQPMRDALAAAERRKSLHGLSSSDDALHSFCFLGWADFLNRYAYKMDEAIEVYETALERFSKHWSATAIKDCLCQLYYHKAKVAENAGTNFDLWVSKLEGLAKSSSAKGVRDTFVTQDPYLMLGLWYRLHGNEQEARHCFRTDILNGIDTLTDDDPENDMFGYMTLAVTLLKAGDRENAGAAFAVTTAGLDRLKADRQAAQRAKDLDKASKEKTVGAQSCATNNTTSSESIASSMQRSGSKDAKGEVLVTHDDNGVAPDDEFDLDSAEMTTQIKGYAAATEMWAGWGCDGKCRRRAEDWQEIHFCEICTNYTLFCDECIKLVKAGTLPSRACDKSHTFYQAYPVSQEMLDVATTRIDGKVLPRKEWLEALRKEWIE